jgi:hypothetical protein
VPGKLVSRFEGSRVVVAGPQVHVRVQLTAVQEVSERAVVGQGGGRRRDSPSVRVSLAMSRVASNT